MHLLYLFCLSHPIGDKKLKAQVLQSFVEIGCHLFVLPPRFLKPLQGQKAQWRYVIDLS